MPPPDRPRPRTAYLPLALALGLFVGDVATMLLRDQLAIGRVAVSGLISVVVYVAVAWVVRRRPRR